MIIPDGLLIIISGAGSDVREALNTRGGIVEAQYEASPTDH